MGAIGRTTWRRDAARFGMVIECKACGENWQDGDPVLRVACPRCEAGPGEGCSWSGPHGATSHIARDVAAMRAGVMSRCAALTWDGRHSRHAVRVCLPVPPVAVPIAQISLL